MINKLPGYYRRSKILKDLYDVLEAFLKDNKINDKDLFIITASNFDRHLKDVGLSPDIDTDDETKRSMVLSRLQGDEIFTKEKLFNLIKLYEETEFTITEYPDEYKVVVDFTERKGMPRNIKELRADIEELKPAHIDITFNTQYVSWEEAAQKTGTWQGAKQYTWGGLSMLDTASLSGSEEEQNNANINE